MEQNSEEYIQQLKEGSWVILVRHAWSQANQASIDSWNNGGDLSDYSLISARDDLRDCSLVEDGIKQWENAQKVANSLSIHTVFVSPMRRALETAYHIFKNHPDFDKIKFIIVPKAKEGVKATADVSGNIDVLVTEFKEKFPNFDDLLLNEYSNRLNFFFEDLQPELLNEISPKITSKEEDCIGNNIFEMLQEKSKLLYVNYTIVKVNHPGRTESKLTIVAKCLNCFNRRI